MRKLLAVLAIIGLGVMSWPTVSSAASVGELIKTAGNPTIYYYGYDGKRHTFPTEATYRSWYADFSNVKNVTATELAAIPLGPNITVRPGTYLIKITTDPKVYAVEPPGTLRHIESVAQAELLYGRGWQNRVIDLPDPFFGDYKNGGALPPKRHPTGTLFRYEGEFTPLYLLTNGYSRKFSSTASWSNYHFNDSFTVTIPYQTFLYLPGDDIDQFKVALSDTAQTLIAEEASNFANYRAGSQTGVTTLSTVHGLTGDYYQGTSFNRKSFTRTDAAVDFNWGYNRPRTEFEEDLFSVRWTGDVVIDYGGDWTFYTYSDDGVRLFIDDKLVLENWTDHKARWDKGTVYLGSGRHKIKLEYYERDGHAVIKLGWKTQGAIIPTEKLYTLQ
ncbi:MAG: PA14 domain-containing protein [Patescibacteria group bacterium]